MPEQDGALLRALFLEHRHRDDICKEHGVSREYLRVLLHRAKERFRKHYHNTFIQQAREHRRMDIVDKRRRQASD
jgi:RNA polymerase sigma-70 factor (ECF subfamily)